jgi:hypothetical protein
LKFANINQIMLYCRNVCGPPKLSHCWASRCSRPRIAFLSHWNQYTSYRIEMIIFCFLYCGSEHIWDRQLDNPPSGLSTGKLNSSASYSIGMIVLDLRCNLRRGLAVMGRFSLTMRPTVGDTRLRRNWVFGQTDSRSLIFMGGR